MSMPIKDTPILIGEDAIRFQETISNPIKVSKNEYDKAKALFNNIFKRRMTNGDTRYGSTCKR
jgi:hypothetical protein